jgi:amidophosphoribosyltransferase
MCGVVGIFDNPQAYILGLSGLRAIQTRGTDAAGAAVRTPDGIRLQKGPGHVDHVFPEPYGDPWPGDSGIFHVRYGTEGSKDPARSRLLAHPHQVGSTVHCFNGNTPDLALVTKAAAALGVTAPTGSDNELMAALLDYRFGQTGSPLAAVRWLMQLLPGAYSGAALINGVGVAYRDPHGVRPLVLGRLRGGGYVVASETEALNHVRAQAMGEVLPGEALFFGLDGRRFTRLQLVTAGERATCSFEDLYTMFPTSEGRGVQVAEQRMLAGMKLWAEEDPDLRLNHDDSVVVGVPDSGLIAANGYSWASGIRQIDAILRRHHSGIPLRSFILPGQDERRAAVFTKLAFILRKFTQGRRVVLVDDSIVRGNTMKILVELVRDVLRAAEVHVRSASPMITHSCRWGVDTAREQELVAHRHKRDAAAICAEIGADSLRFLSLDGFMATRPRPHESCYACMGGKRPVPPLDETALATTVKLGSTDPR